MLVLQRKAGQSIIVGDNIVIHISRISGNSVKVAVDAPAEVAIRRSELPPTPSAIHLPPFQNLERMATQIAVGSD